MIDIMKCELRRDKTKLFTAFLVGFLIVFIVILQLGIEKVKLEQKQKKQFSEVQIKRTEGFINYQQYGAFGLKRLLVSSPLISLFYNSSTLKDLQSNVEISTQFQLYKPEMGKNIFERPTGGNLDFSWFLFIFGSLLVSGWNFFALRNREFIRFLNNRAGILSIFLGIMAARALLIFFSIILLLLAACLLFLINGIPLGGSEITGLLHFLWVATIIMVVLAAVSAGLGAAKNWKKGAIIAGIFWLLTVFAWPEVLNAVFSRKAEITMKSLEEHQMQKNDKLLAFEKKALENTGRYEIIPEKKESDRKSAEHYWNVVSREIEKLDLEMIRSTEDISGDFHFWSIFNPFTFYKSVNNELGSKGYHSYNKFFKENLKIQRGFLRFVFNKRYYENYSKVAPYLPEDRLVEEAQPSLPSFYAAGLVINHIYIFLALLFCYWRFKRYIFPPAEFAGRYDDVEIKTGYGEVVFASSEEDELYDQVFCAFSGKGAGFNGKIIDDEGHSFTDTGQDAVYVPNQAAIPPSYTVEFFIDMGGKMLDLPKKRLEQLKQDKKDLLKITFSNLETCERACLLLDLCLLKDAKIYLLREFSEGIFRQYLHIVGDKLDILKNRNALILCLSDIFMTSKRYYLYKYDKNEKKYIDMAKYQSEKLSCC